MKVTAIIMLYRANKTRFLTVIVGIDNTWDIGNDIWGFYMSHLDL